MTRRILTPADLETLQAKREEELELLDAAPAAGSPPGGTASALKPDEYSAKLLKLIPGEVVAVFLTLDGIIRANKALVPRAVYWVIFVVLIVATYLYIRRASRAPDLPPRQSEPIVAAISFCVWVFAIGGPFSFPQDLGWYHQIYGALLLPLYTFVLPLLFPSNKT